MKKVLVAVVLALFASCYYPVEFVQVRDVPLTPSVVVIPAAEYSSEIEYANLVESAIMRLGVSIIQRPGTKAIESTTSNASAAGAVGASGGKAIEMGRAVGVSVRESYFAFGETNADYIVFTNKETARIKVFKKSTGELIASFLLDLPISGGKTQSEKYASALFEPFKAIGLKVRIPVGTD